MMLRKPGCYMAFGDETSLHFIETVLTSKNDRNACRHFLKSEAAALAKLGAECIKFRSERSRELWVLLYNRNYSHCNLQFKFITLICIVWEKHNILISVGRLISKEMSKIFKLNIFLFLFTFLSYIFITYFIRKLFFYFIR